jgi:hypothetical protein
MTDHRFLVGQQVLLDRNALTRAAGVVEVLRQLPSDVDGAPQYRVKATGEGFERLAKEHQLSAVMGPPAETFRS